MNQPHDPVRAAESVKQAALELGFSRVGFAPAERMDLSARRFEAWLSAGYHGSMRYLEEGPDRADPRTLLPEAKTLIVVALDYRPPRPGPRQNGDDPPLVGRVAAYASGADYHELMKQKLRELSRCVAAIAGRPVSARVCVDTAPLLERAAAERSGVGFSGKSTLLISPGAGSYQVLGELLVDVELAPSPPELPGCGSCRACLDACPTGAFVSEHVLDARRCIAYLTIEHVGSIPGELRALIGDRVFGCDDCQSVCPYNAGVSRRASETDPAETRESGELDLLELLEIGSKPFRRLVRSRALGRVSRARMARNAAIALGNLKDARAVPALCRRARSDSHALVRKHAAWALGQIGGEAARRALEEARDHDANEGVREEARLALSALDPPAPDSPALDPPALGAPMRLDGPLRKGGP